MSRAATLSRKKNMSRPVFFFGRAVACCLTLFLLRQNLPNGHTVANCCSNSHFFSLAGVARGCKCAERTLSENKEGPGVGPQTNKYKLYRANQRISQSPYISRISPSFLTRT